MGQKTDNKGIKLKKIDEGITGSGLSSKGEGSVEIQCDEVEGGPLNLLKLIKL